MSQSGIHIGCIVGTRPEIIKMAPVLIALKKMRAIRTSLIFTGQHQEIAEATLKSFDITPDFSFNFERSNSDLGTLVEKLTAALNQLYLLENFSAILVQGDTTSALVGGLLAAYQKIPVGHVEAGLRSYDRENPFPEEINRVLLSQLTTWHFAPTENDKNQLLREHLPQEKIYVTGNTIVDAVKIVLRKKIKLPFTIHPYQKIILVTTHRRENFGPPLQNICEALKEITEINNQIEIIFSVHPNPNVKQMAHKMLMNVERIHLIEPLPYDQFISLIQQCSLILTDSGGIQEESSILKKPLLILREKTERTDVIHHGFAKLIGTDRQKIINETLNYFRDESLSEILKNSPTPYGDGTAGNRIADILVRELSFYLSFGFRSAAHVC